MEKTVLRDTRTDGMLIYKVGYTNVGSDCLKLKRPFLVWLGPISVL
jgi:hypothetical protein